MWLLGCDDAAEVINACHIYTNIPAKGEAIALAVIRQKCLRFGNLWYACHSHPCPSGEAVILSCELCAVFVTLNLGDADGHGTEP